MISGAKVRRKELSVAEILREQTISATGLQKYGGRKLQ
jgi:hypothetical protein